MICFMFNTQEGSRGLTWPPPASWVPACPRPHCQQRLMQHASRSGWPPSVTTCSRTLPWSLHANCTPACPSPHCGQRLMQHSQSGQAYLLRRILLQGSPLVLHELDPSPPQTAPSPSQSCSPHAGHAFAYVTTCCRALLRAPRARRRLPDCPRPHCEQRLVQLQLARRSRQRGQGDHSLQAAHISRRDLPCWARLQQEAMSGAADSAWYATSCTLRGPTQSKSTQKPHASAVRSAFLFKKCSPAPRLCDIAGVSSMQPYQRARYDQYLLP